MYKIKKYSYDQAKKLGVEIKQSSNPKKKIDVFKNGVKIASIGAKNYADYPSYLEIEGKQYAENRRRLYKARHEKTRKVVGSNSWWADNLLW
jgi:hypothetical protein